MILTFTFLVVAILHPTQPTVVTTFKPAQPTVVAEFKQPQLNSVKLGTAQPTVVKTWTTEK